MSGLDDALIYAASSGKIVDICLLIADGADIEYEYRYMKDEEEIVTTPLIEAVVHGH